MYEMHAMTPGPLAAARAALAADRAAADPAIWIARLSDDAILAHAHVLENEGPRGRPLWGLTFAVKDNIDVAGMPTTAACPEFAHTPAVSAPAAPSVTIPLTMSHAASSSPKMILSRIVAQPSSRLNSTDKPYFENSPTSLAMMSGALSFNGTKPMRSDFGIRPMPKGTFFG